MIHNMSNFDLNCLTDDDKILIIRHHLLSDKSNKNRNSVMYYSKNSLPKADNIGKMSSMGDGSVGLGFIYSVCFEPFGIPRN